MFERLGHRLRAWIEARQRPRAGFTLTQRSIYILPTKAGWGFALTLAVMLLASINYQLNLGYALTFLLGGAGLVSMHQTHANLRRLQLRLRDPLPVFAGDAATVEVVLHNPGAERHGIGLGWHAAAGRGTAFIDVPAQGSAVARLRLPAPRRGLHPVPVLRVATHFPLGLFRAWGVWRPAAEWLVYPAPEAPPPGLPAGRGGLREEALPAAPRRAAGGEFDGVRPWRRGDAMRQVAWKKVARAGELVSRDTTGTPPRGLTLRWQDAGIETEARLSRLAAWVLAAEQQGRPYALEGGGLSLARGLGDAQKLAALQALARWPQGSGMHREPEAASGGVVK